MRMVLAVLTAILLAGCSDGGAPMDEDADPEAATDGPSVPPTTAESSVPAPQWQAGQWWEWQPAFGDQDTSYTFCSIVLDAGGSSATLVTENEDIAKSDAAFDSPLLGSIGPSLAMTGWGGEGWTLLAFPLEDGKAWKSTMPNIAWDVVAGDEASLDMVASFDASVGEAGGFRIMGHLGTDMLFEGAYDPAIGWFRSMVWYDVDPGQEGIELAYRLKSTGSNYTGPYFQPSAERLLSVQEGYGFDDVPTEGGQPFADPEPRSTFTLAADTWLYGWIYAEAAVGAKVATLIDPENDHREVQAQGDLDGGEGQLVLDEAGIPGAWQLVTAGAGGYTWLEAHIFGLTPAGGMFTDGVPTATA